MATNYPFIRLFTAALVSSLLPLDELAEVEQQWSAASPGTYIIIFLDLGMSTFCVYAFFFQTR